MKTNLEKILKNQLLIFILLQPVLEIYFFYNPPLSELFPVTLPTIIRVLGIGLIILTFGIWDIKNNKQILRDHSFQFYLLVFVGYSILHLFHVRHFHGVVDYGYSAKREMFYLVRLFLPICLLYIIQSLRYKEIRIQRLFQGLIGLISGSIVISNLLTYSLGSYGGWIDYNFFHWFSNPNLYYADIASKGFFNYANTMSSICFMLTPIMLLMLVRDFSVLNCILLLIHAVAMLMLGTKVAAYGFLLASFVFIMALGFHLVLQKIRPIPWKQIGYMGAIFLVFIMILPVSPSQRRTNLHETTIEIREKNERDSDKHKEKKHIPPLTNKETELRENTNLMEQEMKPDEETLAEYASFYDAPEDYLALIDYIEKNYNSYPINARFIKQAYPYYRDPFFWRDVMNWSVEDRLDNRKMERAIIQRVKSLNDNPADDLLGISYVRMSNIFNIEQDFVSHYYTIGILGVLLLLGPYLACLLFMIYNWLQYKSVRVLEISTGIISIGAALCAAYFSGNALDFLIMTFILSSIEGVTISKIKTLKNRE
jgi:hypothetical protein